MDNLNSLVGSWLVGGCRHGILKSGNQHLFTLDLCVSVMPYLAWYSWIGCNLALNYLLQCPIFMTGPYFTRFLFVEVVKLAGCAESWTSTQDRLSPFCSSLRPYRRWVGPPGCSSAVVDERPPIWCLIYASLSWFSSLTLRPIIILKATKRRHKSILRFGVKINFYFLIRTFFICKI